MDYVLTKIIEIEKEAQDIVKYAERKKAELAEDIERETAEMEREFVRMTEEAIERHRIEGEKTLQAAIEKADRCHGEQLDTLRQAFSMNSDMWLNELFDEVVGI